MKKFTFALKKIPAFSPKRITLLWQQVAKYRIAGMTIAFLAAMTLTACFGGSTSEPTRYFTLAVENIDMPNAGEASGRLQVRIVARIAKNAALNDFLLFLNDNPDIRNFSVQV